MSLSSERMLKLMAYADGELEGSDRLEVEAWIASEPDAAQFAHEIADLGHLVDAGYGASKTATLAASFDIADAVMASVAKEAAAGPILSNAPTSLAAARARRSKAWAAGGMVVTALALAAGFLIMLRHNAEAPIARAPAPVESSSEPGVDVEIADTPDQSVRVYYLSNENSSATSVVVWVDESGGK
jgi:anti-sigma factor RsiW